MLISSHQSTTKYEFKNNSNKNSNKILLLPYLTTESNKSFNKKNLSNNNNNSITEFNKKSLLKKYDKYILKFPKNNNESKENIIKYKNNINLYDNNFNLSHKIRYKYKYKIKLNKTQQSNIIQLNKDNQLKIKSNRQKNHENLNKNFNINNNNIINNNNNIKQVNLNKFVLIPENEKKVSLIQKELMIRYLKKNMFKKKVNDKYISVLGEIVDYDNLIPEKTRKKNLLLQFSKYNK